MDVFGSIAKCIEDCLGVESIKFQRKHTLMLVERISAHAGGFSVFAGVGERTREGNDLYKEMIEGVSPFPTLQFLSVKASKRKTYCCNLSCGICC